jgi:hypothetical protein
VRASLVRRLETVDEVVPVLFVQERSHPAQGAEVLCVANPESQDEGSVFRPSAWAGRESEAWTEKALEGRNPGEYRPAGEGKLDPVVNGLAGGSEASKRVKPGERTVPRFETQGDREAHLGA